MKNVPVFGKILMIIGMLGVFILGVCVYSTSQMRKIDDGYSAVLAHESAAGLHLARANRAIQHARAAIANLLIASTPADNEAAMKDVAEARKKVVDYMDKAIAAMPADTALPELKAAALDVIDNGCSASIKAGAAATEDAAILASQKLYLHECSPLFAPLAAKFKDKTDQLGAVVDKLNADSTAVTNQTVALTYGLVLGGLAMVVAVAFFAVRSWITTPLSGMIVTMGRLARGDFAAEVGGQDRQDEVGRIAEAVQVFKESGLERIRLEREAEAARKDAEAERQRNMLQSQDAAERQTAVVAALAGGLDHLSNGDLTYRLADAFPAEYEKLRSDFNSAIEKLDATMNVIAANAGGIRSGVGQISEAADDLSRRTEQQAANLEETAAALDQITATVRKTADGAKSASSAVAATKSDAEHSGEIVRQAVTAMGAIESSSNQVSQIIGVIDEIAFQTNLLALNAGVEAARAGDAGRGFAVVAQEVRALAQRSAEAAKEIKGLISESTQQVAVGVDLVDKTGLALEKIVGQVNNINSVVIEIASSAQEQATGLHQVNSAVNQMDQMTQQNAAMVEESTAASHALLGESDELARLIGQFRTSAFAGGPTRAAAPARPSRPAARPQPVARRAAQGGAAPRPVEASEAGWDEF